MRWRRRLQGNASAPDPAPLLLADLASERIDQLSRRGDGAPTEGRDPRGSGRTGGPCYTHPGLPEPQSSGAVFESEFLIVSSAYKGDSHAPPFLDPPALRPQ